ncbi:MAG: phosphotransferase family protein [Alphaproteobacteria bacterium]|nr:phosphotransferase family protein [Alphaproteobacteria bacterium]MBL7096675.1 phosphotransferase family protein [Alphaproteobacteria bacterium]
MSDGIIGDVVPALRFDEARLKAHLEKHIDGFGRDMIVQQIKGGASNPTYKLTTQGPNGPLSYVLRKKPPGQLLASAHQVDREHRVMKALENTGVPVPRMRLLETDDSIIGTPFYVMDFLEGRIFRDARLPGLTPKERAAVYDELNAALAKLHMVDYQAVGLGDFGRPGGYFERQVARWTKQYRGAESEHIPAMEKLIEVLPGMIPADQSVSIAHGDYRLENTMFHPTEPRLIAVLDWELCTIGHPLADIGYNGFMWHSHGESWGTLDGVDFRTSGIPTEAEYRDAYCRRTGRDHIDNWNFYVAFGVFRLASIGQGVYRRALAGVTPSDRPAVNGTAATAEQALEILYR